MIVSANYQNKNSLLQHRITAKLKSIRTGFKKAADVGKKVVVVEWFYVLRSLCETLGRIASDHKPAI